MWVAGFGLDIAATELPRGAGSEMENSHAGRRRVRILGGRAGRVKPPPAVLPRRPAVSAKIPNRAGGRPSMTHRILFIEPHTPWMRENIARELPVGYDLQWVETRDVEERPVDRGRRLRDPRRAADHRRHGAQRRQAEADPEVGDRHGQDRPRRLPRARAAGRLHAGQQRLCRRRADDGADAHAFPPRCLRRPQAARGGVAAERGAAGQLLAAGQDRRHPRHGPHRRMAATSSTTTATACRRRARRSSARATSPSTS